MVKELSITLHSSPVEGHYSSGSTLTGSLTIEVDEPREYKTLTVRVQGKGSVEWSEGFGEDKKVYSANKVYVNKQTVLWKNEDSPNGIFPVGRYTYQFEFVLPTTCPSSFNSRFGNINYEIEGWLSAKHHNFDHKVNQPFNVSEVVSVAPSPGGSFERRRTMGCRFCMSGDITYNAQLPSSGYTVGEDIPVNWYMENGSGRHITVSFSLKEKITYFANGRSILSEKILSSQNDLDVPPHSMRDTTIRLPIPHCRPAMTRAGIIKSEFLLAVYVMVSWASDSHNEIPVKIGNQRPPQQGRSTTV